MFRAADLRALCMVPLFFAVNLAHADADAMVLPLDAEPLIIKTGTSDVKLKVEIADDNTERARGLMFRDRLPDGQGMLFVFEDDEIQSFWMHNTPQPLDLIYIKANGEIESVNHGEALSDAPITSSDPVRFVLEIAAGESERLGIKPGAMADHPLIDAAAPAQ